jgi:RNA polymerase sigma-32 factor
MSEGGSTERMDFLVSDAPLPDETVGDTIDSDSAASAMASQAALRVLSERELRIIRDRRLRDEGATLELAGRASSASRRNACARSRTRAMEKLKAALLEQNPEFAAA